MSPKLSKAWAFLSGEEVSFTEKPTEQIATDKHDVTVILPVLNDGDNKKRSMAIGLSIDKAQANRVASYMFGLDQSELTESDIKDACKESCNVLGGGLIQTSHSSLGIPEEISAENFLDLQQHARFHVTFASDSPVENHIVLTIIDISKNYNLHEGHHE